MSILSTNHTTSDAMKRIGELAVQALPVVKMHPSNQMYEPQNFMAAGDLVDALVAKVDACPDFDVQGGDQSRRCAALARLGREFAQLRLDSIPSRFDGTVIYENQCDKNLAQTINDCFLISPKAKPGDGELLQAVHRFAVQTTESNKITEIVCQSDLVMYLHTNRSLIYPEFMGASQTLVWDDRRYPDASKERRLRTRKQSLRMVEFLSRLRRHVSTHSASCGTTRSPPWPS